MCFLDVLVVFPLFSQGIACNLRVETRKDRDFWRAWVWKGGYFLLRVWMLFPNKHTPQHSMLCSWHHWGGSFWISLNHQQRRVFFLLVVWDWNHTLDTHMRTHTHIPCTLETWAHQCSTYRIHTITDELQDCCSDTSRLVYATGLVIVIIIVIIIIKRCWDTRTQSLY